MVCDTGAGWFHVRPDNTLVRDNSDFYIPDFIKNIEYSVGYVFRIDKPAKCILPEFAGRYITSCSPGLLIYGSVKENHLLYGNENLNYSLDNTTRIPKDFTNLTNSNPPLLSIVSGGVTILESKSVKNLKELSYELLVKLSSCFSFKIGDMIFAETGRSNAKLTAGELLFLADHSPLIHFFVK